jgi:hypothetical protein
VLASGELEPFKIAVNPSPCGKVFWAARVCGEGANPPPGYIRMIDKAGGDIVTLAEGCILGLAGDQAHVAWAGYTFVGAARIDGSEVSVVANAPSPIAYHAVPLGTMAYWAIGGKISRYPIGVGPCTDGCEILVDLPLLIMSLAVDDAGAYFGAWGSESNADGGIWIKREGAGPLTIAYTRYATTLAPAPDRIYFGDDDGIWAVARDGTNRALIVPDRTAGLVVRGDGMYWTTSGGDAVKTADLRGGGVRTLAANLVGAAGIAVDDVAVYWVDRGTNPSSADGRVMRLAR